MGSSQRSTAKKLTAAGMLITLGIVYGDIGTSPLYVMSAIVNDNGGLKSLSRDYILGSLSLIFWTLMLLTTVKYVLIALRATNNGNVLKSTEDYSAEYVSLPAYKKQLVTLSHDESVPIYADNLVYLTNMQANHHIKKEVLYSILNKRPKRAQVYWFVSVQVTDDPYTSQYAVNTLDTDDIVEVHLHLGFRMSQRVNFYIRQIVQEMIQRGELEPQPQKYTTIPDRNVGDFCFVLIDEELSPETRISGYAKALIRGRLFLQRYTSTPATWFGLEYADVREETVPLRLGKRKIPKITHIKTPEE